MTRTQPAASRPALLSALTPDALAAADRRYPKWATMCQLRRLGLPVLNAILITLGQDRDVLDAALAALATATGYSTVMVRSDGGTETRRYYKGGNTFPIAEAASKAAGLLKAGRAVILMEPTSRFTNQLSALLRLDRDGRYGTFTIEALGPGYDVADLTRGGIPPQVTVTADINWSAYQEPWWTDLRLTTDTAPGAEQRRRQLRLARIAADILTDTGHLIGTPASGDQKASLAEAWLIDHGHRDLWQPQDTAAAVAGRVRGWLDDAYLIAACHPHRGWTCLATAVSDLGNRTVYWDIIDGSRKYARRSPA
jgi:hypothetical protein